MRGEAMTAPDAPVPVTLLTGFLGSGKTTLVNHILAAEHGLRVGVIVNEFGEIGIDSQLITGGSGNVVELANGCVCCSVRDDLLQAVGEVLQRENPPEYLLVETTGLADPLPVARQLLGPRVAEAIRLDGIVTLVDAANFDASLDRAEVAYSQIVYGDILLLNKVDLVEPTVADQIEAGIRRLNPEARILRCNQARVDLGLILDVGAFRQRPVAEGGGGGHHHHRELEDFAAVPFRTELPLDLERFAAFLERPPRAVFRAKGVFHAAGVPNRMIFHQVGSRCTVTIGPAWGPDEERRTELVFIGKGVDAPALRARLGACLSHQHS